MKLFRSSRGLTLIELCIALSILAVITLSTASFAPGVIQNQRADTAIKEMLSLFQLARTQAITSGSIVTICPLDAIGQCSNNWDGPVSLFRDPDNNRSLVDDEEIIKQIENFSHGTLKAAPSHRRYFQFNSLGNSKGTLGNVTYCPRSGDPRFIRKLIINFSGRVRLAQDKNNDGLVENASGKPISCSSKDT